MPAQTQPVTEALARFDAHIKAPEAQAGHALREQGINRVRLLGWPDARNEAWKYTRIAPWVPALHTPAAQGDEAVAKTLLAGVALPSEGTLLVVVNGRFSPALSRHVNVDGLIACSLQDAWSKHQALVEANLGGADADRDAALAALNTALWSDGVFVHVAKNVQATAPIDVVCIATDTNSVCVQPRVLVVAETGAAVTVVETYLSAPGTKHVTNAVTEVIAGDNARVEHYVQQEEADTAAHLGTLAARLGRDSQVHAGLLMLGGKMARREVRTHLRAKGAHCVLTGLTLVRGEQHADTEVDVAHESPHCNSEQVFTSIVDERASAVFAGKVLVAPHAIKTDAKQINKNLLLSSQATAHTRPQLEILADDVKCSHGATVGQLDEGALFYLRSRGLDMAQSRQLLTYAFAAKVLTGIANPAIRARLGERARAWLGLGAVGDTP